MRRVERYAIACWRCRTPDGWACKRFVALVAAVAALPILVGAQSVGATTSPTTGPLTPALAQRLSQNVNQHVIVIMRGQFAAAKVGTTAPPRAHAIAGCAGAADDELREVRATHVKSSSWSIRSPPRCRRARRHACGEPAGGGGDP